MDKKEFKSINEHDIENNFSKDDCVKNIANRPCCIIHNS